MMGWQFRRSVKLGPFRFTVGKRGVSTSVGAGPVRLSLGSDGKVRRTLRIPGTGIWDTQVISGTPRPYRRRVPLGDAERLIVELGVVFGAMDTRDGEVRVPSELIEAAVRAAVQLAPERFTR